MSLEQELALIEKEFENKKAAQRANYNAVLAHFQQEFPEVEVSPADAIEVTGGNAYEFASIFQTANRTFAIALRDRRGDPDMLVKLKHGKFCQIGVPLTVQTPRRKIAEDIYWAIKNFDF